MNNKLINQLKEMIDENANKDTGLILLAVTEDTTEVSAVNVGVMSLVYSVLTLFKEFAERTSLEDGMKLLKMIAEELVDGVGDDSAC